MMSKKNSIACALLVVVTTLVFGNSLNNGFVWDDNLYTANNPVYRDFDLMKMVTTLANGLEYLPVRDVSYAIDFALGKGSPVPFHVTNLLIYVGTVVLVFFYARRCFLYFLRDEENSENMVVVAGFATALLFAVHPIHSEVVSFITCRNALLSTMFFFSAIILFLKSVDSNASCFRQRLCYALSLLTFLLSIFSKANSIILPFILLLHLPMLPRYQRRKSALLTIPFILLSLVAFFAITRIAARATIITDRLEDWTVIGMMTKMAKAVQIVPFYLGKLLFPRDLSVAYDQVFAWSVLSPVVLWRLGGCVVVLMALYFLRRRFQSVCWGACWYLIALVPVLNLFATKPVVADRYALLPSFAFYFVVVALLQQLAVRYRTVVAAVVIVPTVIWWGSLAVARNRVWYSDETLWLATVATSPANPVGYRNLGNIYLARGDHQKALDYFSSIADADPCYYYVLGIQSYTRGDLEAAQNNLVRSLAREINFIPSLYYLGLVYERKNERELAAEMFRQVLKSRQQDKGGLKEQARIRLQGVSH